MPDYQAMMLAYAKLAAISHAKQQRLPRDKFLLLTGIAACRAGWPEVAARCREMVVEGNAAHLINRFATFADALRDADFQQFLKGLDKFCPYERAEHLLKGLHIEPGLPAQLSGTESGPYALQILNGAIPLA
jgi:hypothetical protein